MKIEELMNAVYAVETILSRSYPMSQGFYEDTKSQHSKAQTAITEPWNAAYEAMGNAAKFLDALSDAADSNYGTDGKLDDFINAHMSDLDENTAKPLWAALAAMEGNNAEDN